jgi:hypothetical protein
MASDKGQHHPHERIFFVSDLSSTKVARTLVYKLFMVKEFKIVRE